MRIDAAKHMQPPDLAKIFAKLKRNLGGTFPDDLIMWLEVCDFFSGRLCVEMNPVEMESK